LLFLTPDSFKHDFGPWFGMAWRPTEGFFGIADSAPVVALGSVFPLPGNRHFVTAMEFNELADVPLQKFVAHSKANAGVEEFFVEEETVCAVQVAYGSHALGQHMDSFCIHFESAG
jgi:hypothetical protein